MERFCHVYQDKFVSTPAAPLDYVPWKCDPSTATEHELVPPAAADDGLTPTV